MSADNGWYGGEDSVLTAGESKNVEYTVDMAKDDGTASFFISMGKIVDTDTPPSTITISDIKLIEVTE